MAPAAGLRYNDGVILVLGGTKFLGRHIVEALAAAGRPTVRFHRGITVCDLPAGVADRLGDRNADVSAIAGEAWDAVVDVAAYEPADLERTLELRCERYVLISTISVYTDSKTIGIAEDAPVCETFDPANEAERYGGNKAACERLVRERFGDRATILRPGLIAGPWDPTGRFSYWCERAMRGGKFIVPFPAERIVQFVDARDVARFVERVIAAGIAGTFNVVGPKDPTTMGGLVDTCAVAAKERGAPSSEPVWIDAAFLLDRNVAPWSDLPLWLPGDDMQGVLQVDRRKADSAGLELRTALDTAGATMDWLAAHPEFSARAGLTPEREAALLREASGV
jgi:2'-hydroxyisoflavone reductase